MEIKRITRKSPNYKYIKDLHFRSFPPEERVPMWLVLFMGTRSFIDFIAFYDEDLFCGFCCLVHGKDAVYVRYLTVDEPLRSKGYGSRILAEIRKFVSGKEVILNIEPLDPKAENYGQRVKRLRFYERNGFVVSGWKLNFQGVPYETLSTADPCNLEEYKRILKKLAYGFYNPKVER